MKKREPNYILNVRIFIEGQKKVLGFKVGVHTFIKELENKIADALGLDMIRTSISIYHSEHQGKLNSAQTLFQNNIVKNNENLSAQISNISTLKLVYDKNEKNAFKYQGNVSAIDLTYKYPLQKGGLVEGINLECLCVNRKCINFNRTIIFPLGLGTYNLEELMKGQPCPSCPYKDLNCIVLAAVKQIKLKQCLFTLKGQVKQQTRVVNFELGQWIPVTEDSSYFQTILEQNNWVDVNIIIKPLYPTLNQSCIK
eukprot:TRINITY_DN7630_c0_g2_i1.p1 TRINITY_DN7630_c0_g2~~TRINITY_DN7630_c0_g2_i1.p1  ORF type:complete len:254 (+),score=25.97 TRINITY_DN7630_c0_g2_i1:145-906(+)